MKPLIEQQPRRRPHIESPQRALEVFEQNYFSRFEQRIQRLMAALRSLEDEGTPLLSPLDIEAINAAMESERKFCAEVVPHIFRWRNYLRQATSDQSLYIIWDSDVCDHPALTELLKFQLEMYRGEGLDGRMIHRFLQHPQQEKTDFIKSLEGFITEANEPASSERYAIEELPTMTESEQRQMLSQFHVVNKNGENIAIDGEDQVAAVSIIQAAQKTRNHYVTVVSSDYALTHLYNSDGQRPVDGICITTPVIHGGFESLLKHASLFTVVTEAPRIKDDHKEYPISAGRSRIWRPTESPERKARIDVIFTKLIPLYLPSIITAMSDLVDAETAEEITQDALGVLYHFYQKYERIPQKDGFARRWLRVATSMAQQQTREKVHGRELTSIHEHNMQTPEELIVFKESVARIDLDSDTIKELLTEQQRDVLRYHYMDDLDFEEIVRKMRLSRERVRQIEFVALSKLRGFIRTK